MALYNVPLSGQTLNTTRIPIQNNFNTINAAFLVDHVDYGTPGQGKHNKITFPSLGAVPTFLASEIGLFNQTAAPTGRNDIWMSRGNVPPYPAAGAAFPITGYNTVGAGQTNGWTYLPSGLKIVWGNSTIPSNGLLQVTYSTDVPTFPGFYSFWGAPQITRISTSNVSTTNFVLLRAWTQTTFDVKTSTVPTAGGGTSQFSWMAIGL